MGHTIVFTKKGLKEYKELCDTAVKDGHSSFVHNGSLNSVSDAQRLIKRVEKAFGDPVMEIASKLYGSDTVTIPYEG